MARHFSLVALSLGAALSAAPAQAEVLHLAGGWDIETRLDAKTGAATVALTQSGRFDQSFSFGNALDLRRRRRSRPASDVPRPI